MSQLCLKREKSINQSINLLANVNCERYLFSDKLQPGFKKYIGCGPAIHCVQEIVNYFRSRNSRVFLTAVDASKAFDRVNHIALFRKLRERKLPYCVLVLFRIGTANCIL